MRTDGAIITNAGQELLSYALANNKQVNFTKVKLGKGDVNTFDEAKKLTDVVSFYKQIPITSIARNNAGIVRIRSSFTNADFPLQVVLKEIGVFAVVEGKSEVLFGYVNDGEGESFPPGSSGNIVERVRDIYVGVSTNTQVTAVVDRSVVYATIYDLDEEIAKCAKKITRVNPGNGIHGGGTLGEDITVSIKSNDTSINLDATNGITLKKTDLTENDSTKLFSAKGAFDLKSWLVTNYTTLMNNIKSVLDNDIATKLPHGGYSRTAQDLKNDVDTKVSKTGDTMTGTLRSIVNNIISYKDTYKGVYASEAAIGFTTASNSWAFFIRDLDNASISSGEIYANGDQKVYHSSNKPTPADIGALSQKGGTVTGKTRFESNPEVKNSYPGIDFVYTDGSYNSIGMFDGDGLIKVHRGEQKGTVYTTGFKPTPADIGAVKKTGDTMTGDLNVPNITATQYIYLKDYYGTDSKCSIWYNKERASWRSDTLYLGSKDLGFSDGSIALNSRNSGIIKETLFSGTIYKNSPALLTKPITDFDLIYCFSGDTQDMTPSIFLPEDMLRGNGNRGVFQCNYSDTDGCDSNVRIMDLSYFKMESPSSISCAYIYSGDKYIPDAMYADIKVVGIKFGLK